MYDDKKPDFYREKKSKLVTIQTSSTIQDGFILHQFEFACFSSNFQVSKHVNILLGNDFIFKYIL